MTQQPQDPRYVQPTSYTPTPAYRMDHPDPGPPPLPMKPRRRPRDPNANPYNALAYGIAAAVGLMLIAYVASVIWG